LPNSTNFALVQHADLNLFTVIELDYYKRIHAKILILASMIYHAYIFSNYEPRQLKQYWYIYLILNIHSGTIQIIYKFKKKIKMKYIY